MAPAVAPEQPHVYISLLKCITSLDVDWDKFAAEVGIKSKGNAQRKLKETLKKDDLQLSGGRIIPLDSEAASAKKSNTEKRKKDVGDDGDGESPTKKKKNSKAKGKSDQDNSDEVA